MYKNCLAMLAVAGNMAACFCHQSSVSTPDSNGAATDIIMQLCTRVGTMCIVNIYQQCMSGILGKKMGYFQYFQHLCDNSTDNCNILNKK